MRAYFIRSSSAVDRRKRRVRAKVRASGRLRVSIFRSNRHFYVQVIDDCIGVTLVAASTLDPDLRGECGKKVNSSTVKMVAASLAKRFSAYHGRLCVFDRGPYKYTGVIAEFADSLREHGFVF